MSTIAEEGPGKLPNKQNPEESPLPEPVVNSCDFGLLKRTLFSFLNP